MFLHFPSFLTNFPHYSENILIQKKMFGGNFYMEPLLEERVCACKCGLSIIHVVLGPNGQRGGAVSRPEYRKKAVQPANLKEPWHSVGGCIQFLCNLE